MFKRRLILSTLLLLCTGTPVLAKDFRIDDVVIEGNRRVDPAAIRNAAAIQTGENVSLDLIDSGVQAIFRMGRFTDVKALVEERDGKSVLVYAVSERPLVRTVKFSGNKALSEEKLRPLVTLKAPDLLDRTVLERNIEAIRKTYGEEGYYNARIVPEIAVNDLNEAHIVLTVTEGDEVLIDAIRFEGNRVFSEKELKKAMETKERWFLSWLTDRGAYQEETLANDVEILGDMYMNSGYIQARVHKPQVALVKNGKYLDLMIEIEEGEQFRIGELKFKGDQIRTTDELFALLNLQTGEIFSRARLRDGMTKINDLYADEGYAYVNVAPLSKADPEKRTVDLTIDIDQGPMVKATRIDIQGNDKTIDKVIRREFMLNEGDRFSAAKIRESKRRVQNLGFFEEVKVTTEKGDTPEEMRIVIDVKEKPTGTFSLGFGYSSIDGFIGQTSVTQDNLFGRGLKGNLAASFGSKSTTYQLGLLDPHFLDTDMTLGGDLYRTDREWTDFSKKATGGDIKFGVPLSYNTRTFFVYRYEQKEIYDISPTASRLIRDQEGQSTLSSIYASLNRDTTDYRLDPRTGSVSSASIEFAGLGGTDRFIKYEVDHRYFHPLFWKFVFSARGHLGFLQDIGQPVPIDERYYLGGLNSLRGFEPRKVGPRVRTETVDPATGDVIASDYEYIGGNKAAYGNLEVTFPLIEESGFKGVVFYDAGNAWEEGVSYFHDVRHSAGFGLRWMSPMGPLRLEWGKNLSPRPGEPTSDLQFSIGTMF